MNFTENKKRCDNENNKGGLDNDADENTSCVVESLREVQ